MKEDTPLPCRRVIKNTAKRRDIGCGFRDKVAARAQIVFIVVHLEAVEIRVTDGVLMNIQTVPPILGFRSLLIEVL